MRFRLPLVVAAAAAVLCSRQGMEAQSKRVNDLAVGRLLVAPRDCPDPSFANTVILLVNYDHDGAMGLIINHRTKVPINHALEHLPPASHRADPMYIGGPVDLSSVFGLMRSTAKQEDARHVIGDVYLITSKTLLEKTLEGSLGPDQFHAYAGYCGWGAGQLQMEMDRGVWFVFGGDASWVFDADPGSVWARLIVRTEQNIVSRRPVGGWESAMLGRHLPEETNLDTKPQPSR